ncbi:MAG TPA: hypothetical protein VNE63_17945 [Candidatus Acidoferrales bacterium]|nr:hypothetical protein [Candidatus Acidoferrales bacterium]
MAKEVVVAHSVFGLSVESNFAVPGLPIVESSKDSPDVQLYLGISPHAHNETISGPEILSYTSSFLDESGEPVLRMWSIDHGAFFHLIYSDGPQFWLDREGTRVWAAWPDTSSLENAVSYLLGPVLGVLLRYRGVTCLHASAVAVDDCAVAFVGPPGAGKSTTAAALAQRGYAILSDDIVTLEEEGCTFQVKPAYPHLWLWPESVELVYGTSDALPRPIPNGDKRRLSLANEKTQFEKRALPLSRIYLLGERRADGAPHLEAVPVQTALMSLVANTYATNILDREMRAKEFALLGRLASSTPIRRLHAQQNPARLTELCDLLSRDFESCDVEKSTPGDKLTDCAAVPSPH